MTLPARPSRIAVVGLACRYPGADSPTELWENVLAQRQAFRPLPPERLPPEYFSADPEAPDLTYCREAALLEGWEFDRSRFGISENTYEATDPAHWLALEVAHEALEAGFPKGTGLPRERTGVIVGNTLTGDASRASSLRLRWPYFRRVAASLELSEEQLHELERRFKAPFAEVGEDTLAGGLANTIAGRICNHFDLGGGGFTVDGACSSSLLAVTQACTALLADDLDVALAGGVDLSLDPFELIGFAKCRALTTGAMRVYDRRAGGFLPGEGCGFLLLMREEDARARDLPIVATLTGWGVSSDGHGGITRPEVPGQMLALERAYRRAGYGADTVGLFEGHGTGTPVGDKVEVEALCRQLGASEGRHYLGSVKANIGHTKAAAGLAGLLKAIEAVSHGAIPPTTACSEPIEGLSGALRIAEQPLEWPAGMPRRASVSAMGFGGINTHVTLEREAPPRPFHRPVAAQDGELFLFGGASAEAVSAQMAALLPEAGRLSYAELSDLAVRLGEEAGRALEDPASARFRCALVATSAADLARQLAEAEPVEIPREAPRVAFLFPGQGSPVIKKPGLWQRRFPQLELAALWPPETAENTSPQAAMVAASLAALRVLRHLGIEAEIALGHSLGELAALCWAGALGENDTVRLAAARGAAMQEAAEKTGDGGMVALACGAEQAEPFLGEELVIAALNSPRQTVLAGPKAATERALAAARAQGLGATLLPVVAAFHSPAMAGAEPAYQAALAATPFRPLARRVVSSIAGRELAADENLAPLLLRQLTSPVLFVPAQQQLQAAADLCIEVGAGEVLAQMAAGVSTRIEPTSVRGLLEVAAAFFRAGGRLDTEALSAGRSCRAFDLQKRRRFLESPCERQEKAPHIRQEAGVAVVLPEGASAEEALRLLVAEQTRLPLERILPSSRLLADLHLSSITVARLLGEAARKIGAPPLLDAMALAGSTVAEAAAALELARRSQEAPGAVAELDAMTQGIGPWVRAFEMVRVEAPLPAARPGRDSAWQFFGRDLPDWRERLAKVPGRGHFWLAPLEPEAVVVSLLAMTRAVRDGERLVVVQDRPLAAGFARSLFLERPRIELVIVNVEKFDAAALDQVAAEAQASQTFSEVFWSGGSRSVPRLQLPAREPAGADGTSPFRLDENDVLLVSGGAKGIGFESALHLVQQSGARCLLLGRSPASDPEVAANLARLAGHRFEYLSGADVRQPLAPHPALREVTVLLHAAGVNRPALAETLDAETVLELVATKSGGLEHLLAAVDPSRLRLLLTFGSVIARSGLRGEAHYALANEWLANATENFAAQYPACRVLCLEYSVWAGGGMGQRLGAVESLRRQGVMPMAEADALLATGTELGFAQPVRRVISGRLGEMATLSYLGEQLPLLRFLEKKRIHVPGVELVADAELSPQNDPYLEEHVYDGAPLLPAVVGLEAMAQAYRALTGETPRRMENIELRRPLFVDRGRGTTLRVAALAGAPTTPDGAVELALRGAPTEFLFDHFRARFPRAAALPALPRRHADPLSQAHPAGPATAGEMAAFYDRLLFHHGRFRRVHRFLELAARSLVAELGPAAPGVPTSFFHRWAPQELLLGDPGLRDAAIHALQAAIPQAVVLPAGVGAIDLYGPLLGEVLLVGREIHGDDEELVWDLELYAGGDGRLLERWHGLRLRQVARRSSFEGLPASLWGPLLERELGLPVVLGELSTDEAMRRAGGSEAPPPRRADGKPCPLPAGRHVSASSEGRLSLAVADSRPVGCDLQRIADQPWQEILTLSDRKLAELCSQLAGDPFPLAAARIWAARESCFKRSGDSLLPLVLASQGAEPRTGRLSFDGGGTRVETFAIGEEHVAAVARAASGGQES